MAYSKLSIIVPVYNMEKYIQNCIDSILGQTYQELELILINDGSTDRSKFIIEDYAQSDDRIVAIHKENGGIGSAYKAAFEVMTGDYVLFVDSDDWLELHAVEKLINLAVMHDADMVSFGIKPQNENRELVNLSTFDNIDLINTNNESILKTHFEVLKHPTLVRLYQKSLFEGITVFEQNIGIDEMLTPQLLIKCNRAVYTSEVLYNVLVRQDSVCRSVTTPLKVLQVIKVYNFILSFFEKKIPDYLCLFKVKYLRILIGYFFETMGALDFNTYSKLAQEIKILNNDTQIKNQSKTHYKRAFFLKWILKIPLKISYNMTKLIKKDSN